MVSRRLVLAALVVLAVLVVTMTSVEAISNTRYSGRRPYSGSYVWVRRPSRGSGHFGGRGKNDRVGTTVVVATGGVGSGVVAPGGVGSGDVGRISGVNTGFVEQDVTGSGVVTTSEGHDTCRYYCRTPDLESYCCEDDAETFTRPALKDGVCPPVETSCSLSPNFITCSNDARCPDLDKCCFDSCHQRHICTPPSPF